ncbi:hypothetical protein NMY22_g18742 [Coprinellus aureogranulatus]|nr:hypothetical protein NMY22_g18742 [Coprinellus aureogranulatus]
MVDSGGGDEGRVWPAAFLLPLALRPFSPRADQRNPHPFLPSIVLASPSPSIQPLANRAKRRRTKSRARDQLDQSALVLLPPPSPKRIGIANDELTCGVRYPVCCPDLRPQSSDVLRQDPVLDPPFQPSNLSAPPSRSSDRSSAMPKAATTKVSRRARQVVPTPRRSERVADAARRKLEEEEKKREEEERRNQEMRDDCEEKGDGDAESDGDGDEDMSGDRSDNEDSRYDEDDGDEDRDGEEGSEDSEGDDEDSEDGGDSDYEDDGEGEGSDGEYEEYGKGKRKRATKRPSTSRKRPTTSTAITQRSPSPQSASESEQSPSPEPQFTRGAVVRVRSAGGRQWRRGRVIDTFVDNYSRLWITWRSLELRWRYDDVQRDWAEHALLNEEYQVRRASGTL